MNQKISEAQSATCDKIMHLYDIAEKIVNSVDKEQDKAKKNELYTLLKPVINQIVDTADSLINKYIAFITSGFDKKNAEQIENIIVTLLGEIANCNTKIEQKHIVAN